jgi:hypothetical protein
VKSVATPKFWQRFHSLPPPIQKLARKNFDLWRENPSHLSLHFKPVNKFWSVRIGSNYRAVARKEGDVFIWFWIGSHDDYECLIG